MKQDDKLDPRLAALLDEISDAARAGSGSMCASPE